MRVSSSTNRSRGYIEPIARLEVQGRAFGAKLSIAAQADYAARVSVLAAAAGSDAHLAREVLPAGTW